MKKAYLLLLLLLPLLLSAQKEEKRSDKALWLRYPAISPDGERIAFAYKGDLWSVSREGGRAQRLTSHPANELLPVWSPDGEKIAFVSDRYGNDDLFIMPSEGGSSERLSYHSQDDRPGSFTPDGEKLLFSSTRLDDHRSSIYPHRVRSELYTVPVDGGRVEQLSTVPIEEARMAEDGRILYQDRKGYEDRFRKHHNSSVTKDIRLYDPDGESYRKLTHFDGEDRDPVWAGDDSYFFLSERNGDFNVFKGFIGKDRTPQEISSFEDHPCRYLSRSDDGILCFSYDGRLFTMREDGEPQEVEVRIRSDRQKNQRKIAELKGRVDEMALSPNGKEIAFIDRGEVFVTSVEHKATKRITDTPYQERSVDWAPDGRSLVYASEREGSWNIYRASIQREEEEYFYISTLIEEEALIEDERTTFQPRLSPEGDELAFIENRTSLRVMDLEDENEREILPEQRSYSYQDGDQWYRWSPDGEWFLVKFVDHDRWPPTEVGVVNASGEEEVMNLTNSGYNDGSPKWAMEGQAMIWTSDKHGMRSHGSWGSQKDVYGLFFDPEAHDRFQMDKTDYELWREEEKEEDEEHEVDPMVEDPEARKERLTIHSSRLSDAVMTPNGEKLYYLSRSGDKFALWMHEFHEDKTSVITKFKGGAGNLIQDPEKKKLYLLAKGRIIQVDPKKKKKKPIKMDSEMTLDEEAEREQLFLHVWRQTRDKFYVEDMHGVDWDFYREEYSKFLPHIDNDRDLSILLSEMLGELNASHTGARHIQRKKNKDRTASLGLYFDREHEGDGLRIAEVMKNGPLDKAESRVEAGHRVRAIDGIELTPRMNHWRLLNRKKDERVLLSLRDPESGEEWEEVVRPISLGKEKKLRYERWVERKKERVDSLSDERVGYVHIEGMTDRSFRKLYKEVLGRYNTRDALIVDTRFNGGGWLHDDLATLLSGEQYLRFRPRGQENLGSEPLSKWTEESCVLMNEGNYSDAHLFPYVYKTLDIGPLVGMPVPGTGTAVWWEHLVNGTIVLGIPQVGMESTEGTLVENEELQPDLKVDNPPEVLSRGGDQQLERAVEEMTANDE